MTAPAPVSIRFAPVTPADYATLRDWIAQPHWQAWWGDPDAELADIAAMAEGRDTTCRPFLFSLDGVAAGYIQAWDVGPHQIPDWADERPWLMELPADAVGVDLSIADGERLSQGLGSAVLRRFVEALLAEGRRTVVIDPDLANTRAVAAYRRAGFRPIPALLGRTGDTLLMHFDPDTPSP